MSLSPECSGGRARCGTGGVHLRLLAGLGHSRPFRHRTQPADAGLTRSASADSRPTRVVGMRLSGTGMAHTDELSACLRRWLRIRSHRAGACTSPIAPHWVHNGPALSLSVTGTYFTAATERAKMIEAFSGRLPSLHLTRGSLASPSSRRGEGGRDASMGSRPASAPGVETRMTGSPERPGA
jgi:hypothetical protein